MGYMLCTRREADLGKAKLADQRCVTPTDTARDISYNGIIRHASHQCYRISLGKEALYRTESNDGEC